MKKSKFFLLLTVTVISLYGCCQQITCPDFTKDEKSWMPYKNEDTLVFKNFTNDSVAIFHTVFYKERQTYLRERMHTCPNGCINGIYVNISPVSGYFWSIDFYIEKSKDSFHVFAGGTGMGVYRFNPDTIDRYWLFYDAKSIHHDSLMIGNQLLYDVFEYSNTNPDVNMGKIYVKKGLGIVKISYKNNQTFELIKIKTN